MQRAFPIFVLAVFLLALAAAILPLPRIGGQPGETLASIARRYGVSVSLLRSFNDLQGDRIVAGRRLAIP